MPDLRRVTSCSATSGISQQIKIDGAPDTILVDAEVVAIIRAQQEWAATWLREHAAPQARPRHLLSAKQRPACADDSTRPA